MAIKLSAEDKKWRAEDDARMMAGAEEVKADPARMKEAKKAAKRMADEDMKRAKAMKKIAGR